MGREEKWAELGATSSLKTSHVGPLQGSQLRREEWDPRVHSLMTGARILSASIRLALLTFQAFCPSLGPGAHLVQSHLHWSLWVLDAVGCGIRGREPGMSGRLPREQGPYSRVGGGHWEREGVPGRED